MDALSLGRQRVVDAIVGTLLPPHPDLDAATRARVVEDVRAYVAELIRLMPRHLALPYAVAIVAFEWLALPLRGRRFRALDARVRAEYLRSWSDSRLGPMRDFVKLIASTALFAYYDHPSVRASLEGEAPPAPTLPREVE